jgi:hypothetical protein
VGSLLVSTLNAAALLLASAASGATIALHLAAAQTTERPPLRAASPVAIAPAAVDQHDIVTGGLRSMAQAGDEAGPGTIVDVSATKLALWTPSAAAPSVAERELTFAWGYALRHPEALARTVEPNVTPAPVGAPTRRAERISKAGPRRPPERQRASVVQGGTVGVAPSGLFADVDRDVHQGPSYTEPQKANGARTFRRAQSPPSAPHRSLSSSPHA